MENRRNISAGEHQKNKMVKKLVVGGMRGKIILVTIIFDVIYLLSFNHEVCKKG